MKEESVNDMENDASIPCDVCRSPYPEDQNEMVFCDKCNVCVHQACYGVKTIPEGDWLCKPCAINVNPPCILCPKKGGAMKCTSDGQKWAHVSCVWWMREVRFSNPDLMEPIENISMIPSSCWNLKCSLCKLRTGACIQCVIKHCKVVFHVTCAYDKGLKMDIVEDPEPDGSGVRLLSYCWKHCDTEDSPEYEKDTIKRKTRRRSDTTPHRFRPRLERKGAGETADLVDSENLEIDSSFDDSSLSSDLSSSSSAHTHTTSYSSFDSNDQCYQSSLTFSSSNGTATRSRIKQEVRSARYSAPELRPNSYSLETLLREEEIARSEIARMKPIPRKSSRQISTSEIINVENIAEGISGCFSKKQTDVNTRISLDKILTDEQSAFRIPEKIPYDGSSPEIVYEHFVKGQHTFSTPITHKNNYGKPDATLQGENIQSLNHTTSQQGTSNSKSKFLTSEEEVRHKKIDSLTSSDENKYHPGSYTFSTPMEHKKNDGKPHSTLQDENIRSSINLATSQQGASNSKSKLLTAAEEVRHKEIDHLTSSDENKYHSGFDTFSTPMEHKSNYGKPTSTMQEGTNSSAINFATAPQGASQPKSYLPFSPSEVTWRGKTGKATTSTQIENLSPTEISNQKSCNHDTPSTSQQPPHECFVTHPYEVMSNDYHEPSSEDESKLNDGTKNNFLSRLTENKEHNTTKRKRVDSSANSEDSTDASSSARHEHKRVLKDSTPTSIVDQSLSSSEREEHYIQFSKVIATVLKNIPAPMATTLEDKIITMCLKSHKQWQQVKSKNK